MPLAASGCQVSKYNLLVLVTESRAEARVRSSHAPAGLSAGLDRGLTGLHQIDAADRHSPVRCHLPEASGRPSPDSAFRPKNHAQSRRSFESLAVPKALK